MSTVIENEVTEHTRIGCYA